MWDKVVNVLEVEIESPSSGSISLTGEIGSTSALVSSSDMREREGGHYSPFPATELQSGAVIEHSPFI